jgi:hypothetical protein
MRSGRVLPEIHRNPEQLTKPQMNATRLPNFLIIGAAKSGTTSLWRYLSQHPQVFFAPIKEPRFFSYEGESVAYVGPGDDKWEREIIRSWDSYRALFTPSEIHRAVGEASNVYLYFAAKTAPRIAARLPHVKLIAILRNPVDRAYSSFLMLRGEGREPLADFRRALREEAGRLERGWSPAWAYTRRGFYAEAIQTYLQCFPREQLRFFLYDDLVQRPQELFDSIFQFLGVDRFEPDTRRRYNVSIRPKSRRLAFLLHNRTLLSRTLRLFLPHSFRISFNQRLREWNIRQPAKLPAHLRAELAPLFREDILRVADLIERDLRGWMA